MRRVTAHQARLLEQEYGASLTQPALSSLTHSPSHTRPSAVAVDAALPRHQERYESGWAPGSSPPPAGPQRPARQAGHVRPPAPTCARMGA